MRALGFKIDTPNRRYEDKSGERDSVMFSEAEKFVQRTKGEVPAPTPLDPDDEKMSPRLSNIHRFAEGDIHLLRALERIRWEQKTRDHAMNYGMGEIKMDENLNTATDPQFYTPFNISDLGGLWVELLEVDTNTRLGEQLPLTVRPAEFEEFVQQVKTRKDLQLQLLRMFYELQREKQAVGRLMQKMMALNHQLDRSMKQEHNEHEKQRLQVLNSTGHLIEALAMMVGNMPTSR